MSSSKVSKVEWPALSPAQACSALSKPICLASTSSRPTNPSQRQPLPRPIWSPKTTKPPKIPPSRTSRQLSSNCSNNSNNSLPKSNKSCSWRKSNKTSKCNNSKWPQPYPRITNRRPHRLHLSSNTWPSKRCYSKCRAGSHMHTIETWVSKWWTIQHLHRRQVSKVTIWWDHAALVATKCNDVDETWDF